MQTITETTLVLLPDEVKDLANRVPVEKQKEVQNVLTQIFAGTADWERQVDAIEVKDIHDTLSIQIADLARKNAKTARIHAEKIFDTKREEVQSRMQDDKLEDSLWLKSKQIMQIKFKAIEDKAEWKAKFVERYEAEQKELRTQLRCEKISKFLPEYNRNEISQMSDDSFSMYLAGVEKTHNDKIEADKKAEEARVAKEQADADRIEKQRLENIRLKKEAEERERLALIERKKQSDLLAKQKADADKREKELQVKADTERKERERLAGELKAKEQADIKAKRDEELRIENEKKAKAKADKKARLAPDKTKLMDFAQVLNDLPRPEVTSLESKEIATNVNTMLVKISNYIKENAEKL
jgi:hypothetical protein